MNFGTYQSLKNLTTNQQVGALFIIVFGVLLLASDCRLFSVTAQL